MKTMKRLLLLLLILGLSLTAAALAQSKPEEWELTVYKLTLENGYRLSVAEGEYPEIIEVSFPDGTTWGDTSIPVYTVHVPTGVPYVYMYAFQDESGIYSYSNNGYYYVSEIWADEDGLGVAEVPAHSFSQLEKEEPNIVAPDVVNDDDPYVQTLAKVKIPVVTGENEYGGKSMQLFMRYEGDMPCYPFALLFAEENINTSVVPAEEIKVSGSNIWRADKEETLNLTALVHPIGATNISQLIWSSSDESIISIASTVAGDKSVDEDYVQASIVTLTPHQNGHATISATCGSVTYDYPVEVRNYVAAEPAIDAVELDKTSAALWHFAPGQEFPATGYDAYRDQFPASLTLTAAAKAGEDSVEDAQIEWSSSNPAVATVNNGVVTAVSAGSATITAACGEIKAECAVSVNSFVAPGYTNHVMGADWKGADIPANEIPVNSCVYDLSDSTAPKSFTIVGSVWKNVGAGKVKTLSSIQAMKWLVVDSDGCVSYTDDGNGTITVTPTGKTGKTYFKPQLLNDYSEYQLTIHFTNDVVEKAAIARTDGQELTYTDTITIGEKSYNVFEIEQGDKVSLRIETGKQISHSGDAWHVSELTSENIPSPGQDKNSETLDLSTFAIGTYEIYGCTPRYESGYKIDASAPGKGVVKTDALYLRVKRKPVVNNIALSETASTIWYFPSDNPFPATGYDAYRDQFPASLTLTAAAKAGEDSVEDAQIEWSSSNPAVATVNNGVVTAVSAGSATITAACGEIKAECAVSVNSFVAPGYTNVSVGSDWVEPSLPSGLLNTPRVFDLSSTAQPRTFTIVGSAYKNVGADADTVKTLSSIQAMTWKITDKNNCVTYTDNGNGTITVTATGNKGVATFQPVLLNGYKNMAITINFSNGFVSKATIVRTNGEPWTYSSKVTIGGEEYNVFEMVQGDAVSIKAETANDITHDYDGWMYIKRKDSETDHAEISTQGKNGATFDLSVLEPGLYGIIGRVPTYEQDYIIDAKGMNKQNFVNTDTFYVRIKEKPAIVPGSGDITGDGVANANDAVLVLQYIAGSAKLTIEQIAAADLTGDGKVDTNDAVLILQRNAGLVS